MQIDWLKFPTLEQVFAEDVEKTIVRVERQQMKYVECSGKGSAGERARARLVATSYRHAVALLREIQSTQKALAEEQLAVSKARQ